MSEVDEQGAPPAGEQEAESQQEQQQPDPIANLKGEFSRKLENQNRSMVDLNSKLESILQTIQKNNQPAPANIREMLLDDPEQAARVIEERAVQKATSIVSAQTRQQQAAQNAVLEIQGKYAEFTQEGSEAGLLAIEKASKLPEHLKGTPEGVRLAMLEAAAELGLQSGKRKQASSDESFAVSSQRSSSSSQQNRKPDPAKDIDKRTLDFAMLMDPSIANDPKRLEALKNASQRKKWNTYG